MTTERMKQARRAHPGTALGALLLTLAVFLALPGLKLHPGATPPAEGITGVQVVSLPPPPSVPSRLPPRASRPPVEPRDTPRPKLRMQRDALVAIEPGLDLALGPLEIGGDFNVHFQQASVPAVVPGPDEAFRLQDLDEPPRPRVRLDPRYPLQARIKRIEGFALLEFVVDRQGATRDVRVLRAEPPRLFEDAAVRAVQQWLFTPGTKDGEAVPVRVRQNVVFKLES